VGQFGAGLIGTKPSGYSEAGCPAAVVQRETRNRLVEVEDAFVVAGSIDKKTKLDPGAA
jgi:hypothetical protein